VRPDELPRIALLGGESSGKTTLAVALAERLHTLWVPEYGRMLWEELRVTLDPQQLVHVAQTQVAWEHEHAARALAMGARWLVCDTTPLTTLQYCLHDHGHAPPAVAAATTASARHSTRGRWPAWPNAACSRWWCAAAWPGV
jgi:HTH-type transcriptional regulator, transcriptional repressor of NAD biosynthesis genes